MLYQEAFIILVDLYAILYMQHSKKISSKNETSSCVSVYQEKRYLVENDRKVIINKIVIMLFCHDLNKMTLTR